jgi:D-lactate dehydrogenase (cytochrome)
LKMGQRTGIHRIEPDPEGMRIIRGARKIREDYPDYLRDESNTLGCDVETLFFPRSPANIAAAVQESSQNGKPLTISGGRTGICGGAVPAGGYLLSLEKMTAIRSLERRGGEFELTVESGLRLADLSQMLRNRELGIDNEVSRQLRESGGYFFYPPDPTETSATVGGTVATNASGARTFFFGPTRRYVAGLDLVLMTGELLRIRRGDVFARNGVFSVEREGREPLVIPEPRYAIPKTKHSAGLYADAAMDLIDLFIGSEGILGIIAAVTLRLIEEPPAIFAGAAFFSSEEGALDFVIRARENRPLALEYFDDASLDLLAEERQDQGPVSEIPEIPPSTFCVYFEFTGDSGLQAQFTEWVQLIEQYGGDPGLAWGALTRRDQLRLKSFRHALPESINKIIARHKLRDGRIHKVGTDMAVPDRYLKEMMNHYRETLSREGIRHVIFGHVGDNHLHVNMLPSTYEELDRAKALYRGFAKRAVEMGGSVSAEHGIGKLKREFLRIQFPQEALDEMQAVKDALDPGHLLNPDTVL